MSKGIMITRRNGMRLKIIFRSSQYELYSAYAKSNEFSLMTILEQEDVDALVTALQSFKRDTNALDTTEEPL